MRYDIYSFVGFIKASLLIKRPVEISIRESCKKPNHNAAAFCDTRFRKGKVSKHVLVFNSNVMESSKYNYFSVIAHELIHASMIENRVFNQEHHHCPVFQSIAKILEVTLKDNGYDLGDVPLYNPETDYE